MSHTEMVDHSRRYPERPILGVGAILVRDGRVLLVERGQEPLKGSWTLPGGVVETGELLRDAVRREVREETGLEVEPLSVVEIFERMLPDDTGRMEYHYVVVDYLCEVKDGEPRPGSDVKRVEWVAPALLRNYPMTEGTAAVIEKALR